MARERSIRRTCGSCGNVHEGSALELVDSGQCVRCKAPFRAIAEPFAVDHHNLAAIVGTLQVPVLLDIQMPGTAEQRAQRVHLERVARKLDGRGIVVTLDADDDRETAWELGVTSAPTIMIFKKGAPVFTWEGFADAALLEEWMRQAWRM